MSGEQPPKKKRRAGGRPFKKGQSGNPTGRPKVIAWLRDLCQQHAPDAVQTLVDCLDDEDGRVRVAAANALLDRGYGKPVQALTDGEGKPLRVGVVILPAENVAVVGEAPAAIEGMALPALPTAASEPEEP